VVALIAVGVVLLTRGSPAHPAAAAVTGSTSHAGGTSSTPPPATAQAATAPAAGVTIPAAFAGTWTGTATMTAISGPSLPQTSAITFTLVAGATTAHENNEDCVNTITLSKKTATVLTFIEPSVPGHCVAGNVTLTRQGADLAYLWTDVPKLVQNTATLHKPR
jgi:hypothetical protein